MIAMEENRAENLSGWPRYASESEIKSWCRVSSVLRVVQEETIRVTLTNVKNDVSLIIPRKGP